MSWQQASNNGKVLMMKKILVIVVLTLLFTNISYSKISKVYYEELYDSCMIEALKANVGYMITKNYCKCSADHFDNNYNDNSLNALVEGERAVYNDVVAFVVSKCRSEIGFE